MILIWTVWLTSETLLLVACNTKHIGFFPPLMTYESIECVGYVIIFTLTCSGGISKTINPHGLMHHNEASKPTPRPTGQVVKQNKS